METKTVFSAIAASTLVCLAGMFAPISSADETSVSLRYAGSGWATYVDGFVADGSNVDLTTGTGKGTFGEFTITITTEWILNPGVACPEEFPLKYSLIYSSTIITYQDQSQLLGNSSNGWVCASSGGQYFGEVSGEYVGGTGRFDSVSGTWVSKFDGAYMEPNLHFRSIRGTVTGAVSRK